MKSRLWRVPLLAVATAVVCGCSSLGAKPWQRGTLAREDMQLGGEPMDAAINDPYKIISVLDPLGNTTGYLYERRPEERTRRSVYLENRVGWGRASVALSMRYMTDDWQVHSETVQLTPRWWMAETTQYLEPMFRWYHQSAAYFYTAWHSSADAEVGFASQRINRSDQTEPNGVDRKKSKT